MRPARLVALLLLLGTFTATSGAAEQAPVERVSLGPSGQEMDHAAESRITPSGRFVVFEAGAHVYRRDVRAEDTVQVDVAHDGSDPNGGSYNPTISADGRYVAFESTATNLIRERPPQDTQYPYTWIFVRDLWSDTTRKFGRGSRAILSGNGRWLVSGTRLSHVRTKARSEVPGGDPSYSGRFLAFCTRRGISAEDKDGELDAYVFDRRSGTYEIASVTSREHQSTAGWSCNPMISASGRYVAFVSDAMDLVPGDTNDQYDVFIRDRREGLTLRVSMTEGGGQTTEWVTLEDISSDGSRVAIFTWSDELSPAAPRGSYLIAWRTGRVRPIPRRPCGGEPSAWGQGPSLSRDGRFASFYSDDPLVEGDTNDSLDVYRRDMVVRCTNHSGAG